MPLIFFGLAAFLLAAGGCGDDANSEGSGSTEITVETGSLPKAQFIKRADLICGKAMGKVGLASQAWFVKTKSSLAEARAQAPQLVNAVLVPTYEQLIDEVSSLGAPASDEEKVAAILEAIQQHLVEAEEDPFGFLTKASPFAKSRRLAEAYGFLSCGGP